MSQGVSMQFTGPRSPQASLPQEMGGVFGERFIEQMFIAFVPQIKALIKEVLADERRQPLIVDYEEAGRMIGTSYEGVRKLVRKGKLTAVSRSGRHRGIAIAELKDYVQRSQLILD